MILDNNLFLGLATKTRLRKLLEDGDISAEEQSRFYRSVRAFYTTAMDYGIKHLPLSDDLLEKANFINFSSRENSFFSDVEFFVERYNKFICVQIPSYLVSGFRRFYFSYQYAKL